MEFDPIEAACNQIQDSSQSTPSSLSDRISPETYERWTEAREFRQNIQNGKVWLNTPPPTTPPERHNPSQLYQCHRKIYYRQLNAPEESVDPSGVFWTGKRFEEELMLPYLEDIVRPVAYVRNSMWVDYEVETERGAIQIRGETDPVIVDAESQPLLITEIKTKRSVSDLDEPNDHHIAQTFAYMEGLSREWDTEVRDGAIIYGSRTTLDIEVFEVTFDEDTWKELVVDWAANHTEYRLNEELPPADPIFGWECQFCSYRNRCGRGDSRYEDVGAEGLLPLFGDYPEEKIVEYLEDNDWAKLTPTLATKFPTLTDSFGVHPWECPRCSSRHRHGEVEWDGDLKSPPLCPSCKADGIPVELVEPSPENQRVVGEQ
jgi:CRISPR/Cas system-associated exonuclease Cas4 (RecB family)